MKISYSWLKTIMPIDLPANEIAEILTDIGLEVEKTENFCSIKGGLRGLVIGEVLSKKKHPNADRLNVTEVKISDDITHKIVCGAPNVEIGQKVVVANVGATLYPLDNEPFKIKKSKIRGVESMGMICAEDEIGLGSSHEGIIVIDDVKVKVGQKASEYYKIEEDVIFDIGLTPNRADAMGHYGVARDLLVALKYRKLIDKNTNLKSINKIEASKEQTNFNVEIKDSSSCKRYSGLIIKDIKIGESPSWLKTRLKSISLTPINNVVDVTNFVLHELGQPLHAFDLKSIYGNKIIVKRVEKNTEFTTLDGIDRKLHKDDLMICDSKKVLCIAGVFGGENSGITDETKSIFLESAYFDPTQVRKTAKRFALNTDASFRFERGVDIDFIPTALSRATQLIIDVCGGKIASDVIDIYPNKIEDFIFEANIERLNSLCGINLSLSEITSILSLLDIKIISSKKDIIKVQVPSYRVDVTREADLAEEILRIYGYNNVELPGKLLSSLSYSSDIDVEMVKLKISNILTSLGFYETISNSLTSNKYISDIKFKKISPDYNVELLNPISLDTNVMRQSLVFEALEIINYNQRNGEPNIKIFEFGKVYSKINDTYNEDLQLVIATCGLQNKEHWFNSKTASSFYQIKGIVENILESLGVLNLSKVYDLENDLYSEGISIKINDIIIAEIGSPSEKINKIIGLKNESFIASIYLDNLLSKLSYNKVKYKEIIKYPKVYRDLSLLIDKNVSFNEISEIAYKLAKKLLLNVYLFDIYIDKKMDDNKKSYAVRFEFQEKNKTLKDNDVDKVMSKISSSLVENLKASLR